MTAAEQLRADLAELTEKTSIAGTIVEGEQLLCLLHGVAVPVGKFTKDATDILFLTDTNYPGSAMDMFWVDEDFKLADGTAPTNADQLTDYPGTGKIWRRFSVHRGPESPWNPNANGVMQQYLVAVRRLEMPE